MVNLETAKQYLVLDPDTDDAVLQLCITAAKEYLANAGVPEDAESVLYELAVYMLAGHWYENRGTIIVGTSTASIERSVQAVIHQLRLKE